tara:strand:- start:394 stop:816 length:423 start_codon:yes stop_codon:yes gene_type:complete
MKKPKYFPNNWKAYKESPDQFFIPLTYNDFFNWKVMGWALPSSIECIIREETNGKISEKVYSQSKAAQKYLDTAMKTKNPKTVYTIVNQDAVQVLYPLKQHTKYKDLEVDTFKDVDMGQFLDEDKDDPDDFDMWIDEDYD